MTTALFLGPEAWVSDPTLYKPLADSLRTRGVAVVSHPLPLDGDLVQWRMAAETNPNWMNNAVTAFGEGYLPTLAGPVVLVGTSRAAYFALCIASAYYATAKHLVLFSPLVDLASVDEFAGFGNRLGVDLNPYRFARYLGFCSIFAEIGNQDTRVGAMSPALLGIKIGAATALPRRPEYNFAMKASDGHSPPPGASDRALAWLSEKGLA